MGPQIKVYLCLTFKYPIRSNFVEHKGFSNIIWHLSHIIFRILALVQFYCNQHVLSITLTLFLNVCLTMSMHGLYTSTQHLGKTLELLNWIRVCPSRLASAHMFYIMSHVTSVNIWHLSHTLVPYFVYLYLATVLTLILVFVQHKLQE